MAGSGTAPGPFRLDDAIDPGVPRAVRGRRAQMDRDGGPVRVDGRCGQGVRVRATIRREAE